MLPNYQYEVYFLDFTYDSKLDKAVKAMDIETVFWIKRSDFLFINISPFEIGGLLPKLVSWASKKICFFSFCSTRPWLKILKLPLEIKYFLFYRIRIRPSNPFSSWSNWVFGRFMPATGRKYGMRSTSDVDDRMDPDHSTEVRQQISKVSISELFGDWEVSDGRLTIAVLGKVSWKAIRRSGRKEKHSGKSTNLPSKNQKLHSALPSHCFMYLNSTPPLLEDS